MTIGQQKPPRRRGYLVAAVVIALLAILAVAVAAGSNPSAISGKVDVSKLDDNGPAPDLDAKGWINSEPLTAESLTGKVVLYDFWTYSCINCVRTFPYIRAWYDRYKADGLVVVGVHSPEFDFEKVHGNVRDAVKRLHVTWPVALDDDLTIWTAFKNRYWPADYVADGSGHLRYSHFGEGDYDNTEDVLRALLGVAKSSPRAHKDANAERASGQQVNPETYLDLVHGQLNVQAGAVTYPDPGPQTPPNVAVGGPWTAEQEKIISGGADARIVLGAHAQTVNLVLATSDGAPVDVVVTLDGQPIPSAKRGRDVREDANGQTVVHVTAPDMYRIVAASVVEDHQLAVVAPRAGVEAYDFTFG
jgi:thiol-disulfide isomerase/thioredoxin